MSNNSFNAGYKALNTTITVASVTVDAVKYFPRAFYDLGNMVHSDVCTSEIDKDYRELLHKCLDEFLNNYDADGYFAIGNFKIGD